jgi:hypothetical protein
VNFVSTIISDFLKEENLAKMKLKWKESFFGILIIGSLESQCKEQFKQNVEKLFEDYFQWKLGETRVIRFLR